MKSPKSFSWFYYLSALEGIIASISLLLIPSEGGSLSPFRIALILILFSVSMVWVYMGLRLPRYLEKYAHPFWIISFAACSILLSLVLFLLRYMNPDHMLSIYERLSPLLAYLVALAIQISLILLYLYNGIYPLRLSQYRPIYISATVALFILTCIFLFVIKTRLGLTFDPAYWGEPGIPILAWQFALALIIGIFIFLLTHYLKPSILNVILPVSIYLSALVIWLSVPVDILEGSYYMPITNPDYQPYPYSDSAYYDQMSQSLLIGHPYQGIIPTRPLYIFFLTILHILFGQDYAKILAGQTLVLALIPVLMYLMGKRLHSRTAGIIIAFFFMFRELTSLMVSSETRVTNTKMLLVDLPTLLLLLLSCLITFRWLENKSAKNAFIAGGMFGIVLLLRTQSLLILFFVILFVFLLFGWRKKLTYLQIALFAVGVIVAIAPWLTHNYLQTGEVAFDSAGQLRLVASQYDSSVNLAQEGQSTGKNDIASILIGSLMSNPAYVLGFITNHFFAAQVNGLLVFPVFERFNGLFEPLNLYWMRWERWDVFPNLYSVLLLYTYLIVISIGLGSVWKRWRWLGILPLAYSIGYAIATALSRYSGWRYDFPSDWIWYFYFGIGFAELIQHIVTLFGGPVISTSTKETDSNSSVTIPRIGMSMVLWGVLFFVVGFLPWMIEGVFPARYTDQSITGLTTQITSIPGAPRQKDIAEFIEQPEAEFEIGRLLYPRFLIRGKGLASANPTPAYAKQNYSRMGFILLNQTSTSVVYPVKNIPGPLPHAGDVIILGCQRDNYIEARLIVLPEYRIIYGKNQLTRPCSP